MTGSEWRSMIFDEVRAVRQQLEKMDDRERKCRKEIDDRDGKMSTRLTKIEVRLAIYGALVAAVGGIIGGIASRFPVHFPS